ncbi:MAG: cytochrome c [Myxococcota bacterium]|nr:cytochrome c [Myxococcota bacterium]
MTSPVAPWLHSAAMTALAAAALLGCRGDRSGEPPVLLERNMYDTERYNPESYSQFFGDHRTMRTPVEGTVARDRYEDDPETATGLQADKTGYVLTVPPQVIQRGGGLEKMLARGQERFGIYCAPCHGLTGDGKGLIVCRRESPSDPCESRGFPPIPAYQDPRIRQMPDGQIFATISHGVRTMPAYGAQVPIADRWAIVSYVRALELSQLAAAKPSQTEPKK